MKSLSIYCARDPGHPLISRPLVVHSAPGSSISTPHLTSHILWDIYSFALNEPGKQMPLPYSQEGCVMKVTRSPQFCFKPGGLIVRNLIPETLWYPRIVHSLTASSSQPVQLSYLLSDRVHSNHSCLFPSVNLLLSSVTLTWALALPIPYLPIVYLVTVSKFSALLSLAFLFNMPLRHFVCKCKCHVGHFCRWC